MAVARGQSSAMLYTVITFVGLFIVATSCAVYFYVKSEDHRLLAESADEGLKQMAKAHEVRGIGDIVGDKNKRESYIGKMTEYYDGAVQIVLGDVPKTSAEVKASNIDDAIGRLIENSGSIDIGDPCEIGLVGVVDKLKNSLQRSMEQISKKDEMYTTLVNEFDDAMAVADDTEKQLTAEKDRFQKQAEDVEESYNELRALMEKSTDEQVQTVMGKLEERETELENLSIEKLALMKKLESNEERMNRYKDIIAKHLPGPDGEAVAFVPDGKLILVDAQAKIVHLNLGIKDRVYRGLTFAIYDKNIPIPKDGKGKAEIEVFDVQENTSVARITKSDIKQPIIIDDVVANLIWSSDMENVFVISGSFDIDGDGSHDYIAGDKIKDMIELWGGKVAEEITIETDYLVLGSAPKVLDKPTLDQLDVDPMAMDKYEASVKNFERYNMTKTLALDFDIPVFSLERFRNFVGRDIQID